MIKKKVPSFATARNNIVAKSFGSAGSSLRTPYGKGKKNPLKVKPIGSYKVPDITKMGRKKHK